VNEPISFLAATGVVAAAAIPLILRIVPPNRFYGFRTSRTLDDRELWLRVNRFAGLALLIAAAVTTFAFILAPGLASGRSFLGLLIFVAPLVTAVGASVVYLRKITAATRE
jgi:uncharacterized membrane protein